MRLTYFTAGSHGAGHVVRACALQRALRRAGRDDVHLTVVAPPSPFLRLVGDAARPTTIDASVLRDPARAGDSDVARAVVDSAPDVVVIDVFWVPLVFISLPCPAWLLLRSVPPAWLVGPQEARFDATRYARVLAIEPAPVLSAFEAIDPIVIVDRSERRARAELAAAVGASVDQPLQVIARGGLPADAAILEAQAAAKGGVWHSLDLREATAPFPAAPLLAAADAVIAAPGYNTFWEARLLGFDARTTWVPIPRSLDDAAWRASLPEDLRPRENGADVLVQMLLRG